MQPITTALYPISQELVIRVAGILKNPNMVSPNEAKMFGCI
jgi:hypothetical protein